MLPVVVAQRRRASLEVLPMRRKGGCDGILIGPTDWEDHLLKKEGAEKYRTHNLPNCASCSGLYELGIALLPTQSGREVGKLKKRSIIPVYIGQADNVRTRLQHYGREGSHLENSSFLKGGLEDCKGNGLFRDIFARGFSIVYRWAPMENKSEAEKKEAQLLNTFDYAWNKGSNGARRPRDIHQKLDSRISKSPRFPHIFKKLQVLPQRKVGVKINSSKSLLPENGTNFYITQESNNTFSRIFKFGRSQPRLVSTRYLNEDHVSICGVALGRGSICIRPPVEGRKRCAEHKGMKINGPVSQLTKEVNVQACDAEEEEHFVCGPIMESRTFYNGTACGVDFEDGTFCTKQPVLGRQRCEEHKGMRVKKHRLKTKIANRPSVIIDTSEWSLNNTLNKSVSGRTVIKNDSSLTCGATTRDGSICRRKPSNGGIWCWQHEGTRVNGARA
ncbi:hypothetical protein LguiA_020104 [Lonicera macranthoides]